MKKHLVVAAGLAVLSTGAFASKARMSAMNQEASLGSYYMYDTRNIWRMPHTMNQNPEFVITEWGSADTAEGGFFNSSANLNYGLYLNADAYDSSAGGNVQNGTTTNPQRFDLFLSSKKASDWGARLGYETMTDTANNEEVSSFDLSVSGNISGANVWLTYITGADKTTSAQNDTNADYRLGATYEMNDYTLFGEYYSEGNTGSLDASTSIKVGAGKTMSMNDTATVYYDVQLVSTSNFAQNLNGFSQDASELMVPVTFGVEAKATDWLTWRASLSQSLYGTFEAANGDESSTKRTTLGVGASLMYGDLQLDGTIATATNGTLGYDSAGTDEDVMSNVSMTYTF